MIDLNELDGLIESTRKTLLFLEEYRSSVMGVHYMTNFNTAEDLMFSSIETVSGITRNVLLGKSRDAELVMYRYIGMNVLMRKVNFGLSKTGKIFLKSHCTSYHAKRQYDNWVDTKDKRLERYNQVSNIFDEKIRILKNTVNNTEQK